MAIPQPPQTTAYPEAPQRGESEAVFIPKANAFVAALDPRRIELQSLADYTYARAVDVETLNAQSVQAAADAVGAAQLAAVNSRIFTTVQDGLDNSTEGEYFSVPGPDADDYLTLYRVVSGAATVIDTYPNKQTVIDVLASVFAELSSNAAGSGSDDVAHTGTTYTVTEALNALNSYSSEVAEYIPKDFPNRYEVSPVVYRSNEGSVYLAQNPQSIYDSSCNKTFFVYGGPGREPHAIFYDHTARAWSDPVRIDSNPLASLSNVEDDHGAPSIAIDNNGFLHVLYGSHGTTQYYAKSDAALDISSWTASALTGISDMTYPSMTLEPISGDIYALFRAGSGHGAVYPAHEFGGLMRLPAGGTALDWVEVAGGIIDTTGFPGAASDAYVTDIEARNGKIYIAWLVADGASHDEIRKDIHVAYYDPADGNLYTVGGTLLGSTITFSDHAAVRVRQADYVWGPRIAFGTGGQIYASWSEAISPAEQSGYYVATWNGSAWSVSDTGARVNVPLFSSGQIRVENDGSLELFVPTGGKAVSDPTVSSTEVNFLHAGYDISVYVSPATGDSWTLSQKVIRKEEIQGQGARSLEVPKNSHPGLKCIFGAYSFDRAAYTLPVYAITNQDYSAVRVPDSLTKKPRYQEFNIPVSANFVDVEFPTETYVEVDVSDYVPDNATHILLKVVLNATAAGGAYGVDFRHPNTGRTADITIQEYGGAYAAVVRFVKVPISFDRKIEYKPTAENKRTRIASVGYTT